MSSYNAAVHIEQGGAKLVVLSGGEAEIQSGGTLDVQGTLDLSSATITASLTGAHMGTVADDNVIGGIPVVHRIDIADGAGDTDVTLTHKTRVIDAWAVKTAANGGAGDTVQVKNSATAITDALDLNVSDTAIVRAGTISDASHEIAAAGTLRVTAANATNNACTVYVLGLRVA